MNKEKFITMLKNDKAYCLKIKDFLDLEECDMFNCKFVKNCNKKNNKLYDQ